LDQKLAELGLDASALAGVLWDCIRLVLRPPTPSEVADPKLDAKRTEASEYRQKRRDAKRAGRAQVARAYTSLIDKLEWEVRQLEARRDDGYEGRAIRESLRRAFAMLQKKGFRKQPAYREAVSLVQLLVPVQLEVESVRSLIRYEPKLAPPIALIDAETGEEIDGGSLLNRPFRIEVRKPHRRQLPKNDANAS
jgi:hypothetical protein